jgi:hypothetical protein
MIRAGEEVQIVDNKTKEDLTTVTLAQIIFEEEKKQRSFMPLGAMRNIIQNGGEWFSEVQRKVSGHPARQAQGRRGRRRRRAGCGARGGPRAAGRRPRVNTTPADEGGRRREGVAAPLRLWIAHSKAIDPRGVAEDERDHRAPHRGRRGHLAVLWTSTRTCACSQDRIAELEAKLEQLAADGHGDDAR